VTSVIIEWKLEELEDDDFTYFFINIFIFKTAIMFYRYRLSVYWQA